MARQLVFLGSKLVGYHCLKHLISNSRELDIEIAGVLTNDRRLFDESLSVKELAEKHGITLLENLDDLTGMDNIDFLISVQYHEILKKRHIETARELAVNLHMAPLPEYRGCNQFSFAIIDDSKIFGTTIHRLEEGIDSGAIIAEDRFEMPENCFVSELYRITCERSIELFRTSISGILHGDCRLTPQKELMPGRKCSIHYRKEINEIKQINWDWPKDKIEKYIRATSMKGFEPPYTYLNGKKMSFVIDDLP